MKPGGTAAPSLRLHLGATEPVAPSLPNLLLEHTQEQIFCAGVLLGVCLGFGAALFLARFAEEFLGGKTRLSKLLARPQPPPQSMTRSTSKQRARWSRTRVPVERRLHELLEQCQDEEAHRFLDSVAMGPRGVLLRRAVAEAGKFDKPVFQRSQRRRRTTPCVMPTHQLGLDQAAETRILPMEALPHIQFASFEHLAMEGETVRLEVIRVGRLDGYSEVGYATKDGTAVEGKSYVGATGKLVFRPGESSKQIEVSLTDNETWDNSLDFKVVLFQEGLVGAVLNPHMWHARIKVIEDDAFPTNVYKDKLTKNQLKEIPKFKLMFEYFRYNLNMKIIRQGTLKMVLVEQCHNFYFLLRLLLTVFLVDDVIGDDEGGRVFTHAKLTKLVVAALVATLPMALLHGLDVNSVRLAVRGNAKRVLEKALLCKFLNYSQAERSSVRPGRVALAVVQDVDDLVSNGFLKVVVLAQGVGEYALVIVFVCSVPLIFGRPLDVFVLVCILLLPALALLFFMLRKDLTTWHLENQHKHFEKMANNVIFHIVPQYSLIAAYNRHHTMMQEVDAMVRKRNKAEQEAAIVLLNNSYMVSWLMTLAVSFYFVFGAWEVFTGYISLGMFLANINVYNSVGATLDNIFSLCQSIETATPALERITMLLNRPDDLALRKVIHEKVSAETQRQLAELTQDRAVRSVDELSITVSDVQYDYGSRIHKHDRARLFRPVILPGTMTIRQGTLALLLGKHRSGRSTLLKLLGGELLPQDTRDGVPVQVFVPSHLRVIHVPGDPIFFVGTLYQNLTYGVSHHSFRGEENPDSDGHPDRVLAICRSLGVSEEILRHVRPESGQIELWSKVLNATDCALLNLARALIANSEVLCLHKPMEMFDEVNSQRVANIMERFVRERGVELDASTRQQRRLRTCIFTSSKSTGVEVADQIFLVNDSDGLREVRREAVTPEMLS